MNFKAVYDLTGHADSYAQISCPPFMSRFSFKIEGTDVPIIINKEKNNYIETPCCLPF